MLARRARQPLRGHRPRALPALARPLLHRRHAVARLPELRRRGQGDGPRALRRAALHRARCASSSSSTDDGSSSSTSTTSCTTREGVDMTWDERLARDRPVFSPRLEELLGPAREPRDELDDAPPRTSRAALQAVLEEASSTSSRTLQRDDRLDEPLPRRRRRAERGRERRVLPRDAVRGALRPARGRRLRAPRSAPRSTSGTSVLGRPRGFVMEHAYTGPAVRRRGVRAALLARGRRSSGERLDDDELFRAVAGAASPTATSSAGSRAGWSSGRARSATARSSPTRAAPT